MPYIITQGSIPATGLARVEVQPATGEAAKPVAANDVALLGADNTAIVEPLTNDVDPMGGVLSVTTVSAPADSGIKVGLVSHKRVYITARQVPTKPVALTYTVANASGTAKGTIVLQPPALATSNSVPKASNINAQVRTDGIVSVDFVLRDMKPVMRIHYVKSMWDDAKLWKEVFQTEKWTLRMADGTFKEADPRLKFTTEGKTVEE